MRIKGSGNIQAGRDVIVEIISGLHGIEDIDEATTVLNKHLISLRYKRGMIDWRIFLGVLAVGSAVSAVYLNNIWSVPLVISATILIYIGMRITTDVVEIDIQIAAATGVLVELYKQKIVSQINGIKASA